MFKNPPGSISMPLCALLASLAFAIALPAFANEPVDESAAAKSNLAPDPALATRAAHTHHRSVAPTRGSHPQASDPSPRSAASSSEAMVMPRRPVSASARASAVAPRR